jgi:hypothetical protein
MRTTIATLAGLTVVAAASAQAAPFSPAVMTPAEVRSTSATELIGQGCGWAGTARTGATVGIIGTGEASSRIGDFTPA